MQVEQIVGCSIKRAFLIFAILWSPLLLAASDLWQIYQKALSNDPQLRAAQSAHVAGQQAVPQARAMLLPSINVTANTQYNDSDVHFRGSSFFPSGRYKYNSNAYNVNLNQPLLRIQALTQYAQAQQSSHQQDATLAAANQELIVRVTQAYFDVLLAQHTLALSRAQKEAIAEQLDQARKSMDIGTGTLTDMLDAQARHELIVAQEIATQSGLEIRQNALQQIIGHSPGELRSVRDVVPLLSPEPNSIEAWLDKATDNNAELQIARANLEIAREEIKKARGEHLPTLDLVATYGVSDANGGLFGSNEQTNRAVGLQLNVPIFQGGATNARVTQAIANQDKAYQDLEAARRRIEHSLRQAFLGVNTSIAQVKAFQQAVITNQSLFDATRLSVEAGVRTNVDLLNVRQQLFAARRDLSQALYNYIVSRLRLSAVAGILREEDVGQVNGWLQPAPAP